MSYKIIGVVCRGQFIGTQEIISECAFGGAANAVFEWAKKHGDWSKLTWFDGHNVWKEWKAGDK